MPFLTIRRGGTPLIRIAIPYDDAPITFGRGLQTTYPLPDPALPELWCTFERRGHDVFAIDGTGDGLHFDLGKSALVCLRDGTTISRGVHELVFHTELDAKPRGLSGPVATATLPYFGQLPASALVELRICAPGAEELVVPWPPGEITVGRHAMSDRVINDRFLSNKEAAFTREQGLLHVRALGSRNGVRVNARLVTGACLELGDMVQMGETKIRICDAGDPDPSSPPRLLGESEVMRKLRKRIQKLATETISVIILGETGTGKEVVAQAIHSGGPRANQPFVIVDCTGLTEQLLESHLFGHEKGSFTGADRQRIGAFERADGGIVFLDEIGDLPLALQGKLLRVLNDKKFRRVGGDDFIASDFRLVAATCKDVEAMVKAGTFRDDLWHRLSGFVLKLPPLRQRDDDWKLLAEQFLRSRAPGVTLSDDAMKRLVKSGFPGNVRKLNSTLERALIEREGNVIEEGDLYIEDAVVPPPPKVTGDALVLQPGHTLDEYTQQIVRWVFAATGQNKIAAADALKMHRNTVTKYLEME